MTGILKMLLSFFTAGVLAPLLLLFWTVVIGKNPLAENYLTRRILLSPFFDLPQGIYKILLAGGVLLLFFGIAFKERSERLRLFAYSGFCVLLFAFFLMLRLPCGVGITMPFLILGAAAMFSSGRKNPDAALFAGSAGFAPLSERFSAALIVFLVVTANSFLYQEGFNFLCAFERLPLLMLIPFAGVLLPSGRRLREYVVATGAGLVAMSGLFGLISVFESAYMLLDVSIVFIFIFIEFQTALLIRGVLPRIKNLSLLILALCLFANGGAVPPVCNEHIVSLSVFILYIAADNLELLFGKILRKIDPARENVNLTTKEGYAAQGWTAGAFIAVCLAGPDSIYPMTFLILLLCAVSILKSWIQREFRPVVLKVVPMLPETFALSAFGLLWGAAKGSFLFAAALACVMPFVAAVWHIGAVISRYEASRLPVRASLYDACANAALFCFLLLLFFHSAPESLTISLCFVCSGIILLGESAFTRGRTPRSRTACAWLSIAAGLLAARLPMTALPPPAWEMNALYCGMLAFFAVTFFNIIDFRKKSKECLHV